MSPDTHRSAETWRGVRVCGLSLVWTLLVTACGLACVEEVEFRRLESNEKTRSNVPRPLALALKGK